MQKGFEMKKSLTLLLVFITLALVLLSSCASSFELAGNALDRGDYATAIKQSLKSIEKEKDVYESEAVLQEAWKRANTEWNAQITTIEQTSTSDELSKAMPLYDKLLEAHNAVILAGRMDLNPSYSEIQERAKKTSERIIGLLFDEAKEILALGGRDNARVALLKFNKVYEADPNYQGIDIAIEQATNQATIKVLVLAGPDGNIMNRGYDMVPMVEQQLKGMEFVEVVNLPNRPLVPLSDELTAINLAKSNKADILVHFEATTSYDSGMKRDRRPIDSRVTAAPNWEIEKLYVLTSANSDVHYKVVDLKNEKILAEKTMKVEESTDYDFYVTAILHKGRKEQLQLDNMYPARTLAVNTIAPGASIAELANQIATFESQDIKKIVYGITAAGPSKNETYSIPDYQLPRQLAKLKNLNGHTFTLFNVIEADSPVPGGQKEYFTFYEEYIGEGVYYRVSASIMDQEIYKQIIELMLDKNNQKVIKKEFLTTFHQDFIPRKVAEWVSPTLK